VGDLAPSGKDFVGALDIRCARRDSRVGDRADRGEGLPGINGADCEQVLVGGQAYGRGEAECEGRSSTGKHVAIVDDADEGGQGRRLRFQP